MEKLLVVIQIPACNRDCGIMQEAVVEWDEKRKRTSLFGVESKYIRCPRVGDKR